MKVKTIMEFFSLTIIMVSPIVIISNVIKIFLKYLYLICVDDHFKIYIYDLFFYQNKQKYLNLN